ncbi:MAG TPA: LysM domain-containing protein [Allosphingosinicella sp.]|nr:LysM domain-containing protein [Allosphingosinicella sp.]
MSRAVAACLALLTIAAADRGPLPHASGRPDGPGPGCGGGFIAARGDTLYSIARRCETSVAELVQENRLGRPPVLAAGQALAIPGFARPGPPRVPEAAPPPRRLPGVRPPEHRPPPPPPPAPRAGGNVYHFQAGDTLYSLARWARTSLAALRTANPDVDPRDIEIGDPIRLPRGAVRPEPLRLRERGRPALLPAAAPPRPPRPPLPPRPDAAMPPPAMRPPPPAPAKPIPEDDADDDEVTPGGMDDGSPEPDGM